MNIKKVGVSCNRCGDKMFYDKKGFRSCKCGTIRIDVGDEIVRIIGNQKDFEKISE